MIIRFSNVVKTIMLRCLKIVYYTRKVWTVNLTPEFCNRNQPLEMSFLPSFSKMQRTKCLISGVSAPNFDDGWKYVRTFDPSLFANSLRARARKMQYTCKSHNFVHTSYCVVLPPFGKNSGTICISATQLRVINTKEKRC